MKKGNKKIFWDHFFKISELTRVGNEGILDRVEKYSGVENFIRRNFALANIPEKYFDFEFEKIRAKILTVEQNIESVKKVEKYLSSLSKAAEKGIGLYLSGPHGVAKTTISAIILKTAIESYFRCFFSKAASLVDYARSGWKNESRKIFWDYIVNNVDFLVIDDIARSYEQVDEAERFYLDQIFTKRDDSNLVTIITSNSVLDDCKDLFGDALYSNFKERLIEVNLIGDDYRNTIGNQLLNELE